tara:strand:- start:339 stop:485 length:147 start_codon:yes stop_codon:yes gene_type:complete
MKCDNEKLKKVVVYIDNDLHLKLKGRLSSLGQTVSGWFRKLAKEEADK